MSITRKIDKVIIWIIVFRETQKNDQINTVQR